MTSLSPSFFFLNWLVSESNRHKAASFLCQPLNEQIQKKKNVSMLTFEALLCSLADLQPWLQSSSSSSCVSFQSCFPAVFFFPPLFSSTFLLSPRPGVPLGTEAICGGGGRAAAEEQQADNRQQLSGGPLCGSVLLSTLGESRKEETFFSFFFSFRFLCFFFWSSKRWGKICPLSRAEPSRKGQRRQIREGNRKVLEPPLCFYVYTDGG